MRCEQSNLLCLVRLMHVEHRQHFRGEGYRIPHAASLGVDGVRDGALSNSVVVTRSLTALLLQRLKYVMIPVLDAAMIDGCIV